jgi:ABC-type nickel/cobalt efflux system permease component RcnA
MVAMAVAMAVAVALAVAMVAMVMAAIAHCAVEDTGPVASTEEFPQWLSLLTITISLKVPPYSFTRETFKCLQKYQLYTELRNEINSACPF